MFVLSYFGIRIFVSANCQANGWLGEGFFFLSSIALSHSSFSRCRVGQEEKNYIFYCMFVALVFLVRASLPCRCKHCPCCMYNCTLISLSLGSRGASRRFVSSLDTEFICCNIRPKWDWSFNCEAKREKLFGCMNRAFVGAQMQLADTCARGKVGKQSLHAMWGMVEWCVVIER